MKPPQHIYMYVYEYHSELQPRTHTPLVIPTSIYSLRTAATPHPLVIPTGIYSLRTVATPTPPPPR